MITDKLNRYLYEIHHHETLSLESLSPDEVVEKLLVVDQKERQIMMNYLDDEMKQKIQAMIESGLL